MNIKPAGKIAIVLVLVAGAAFLIKPMIGKKKDTPVIETTDSLIVPVDSVILAPPTDMRHAPPLKREKAVIIRKAPEKPAAKPVEKKPVSKPKKKGERENLDINF